MVLRLIFIRERQQGGWMEGEECAFVTRRQGLCEPRTARRRARRAPPAPPPPPPPSPALLWEGAPRMAKLLFMSRTKQGLVCVYGWRTGVSGPAAPQRSSISSSRRFSVWPAVRARARSSSGASWPRWFPELTAELRERNNDGNRGPRSPKPPPSEVLIAPRKMAS